MPLTMARPGESNVISRIGGKEDVKRFLESLGFVVGGNVTVVSEISGNVIIHVKDTRVALSRQLAQRIMV